jgi:hypothetical protein
MFLNSRQTLKRARSALGNLYRCERGAEGLEKLLIIGAIVIPLLGLLIFFRDELKQWTTGIWDEVKSDADNF